MSRIAKYLIGLSFLLEIALIAWGVIYRINLDKDYQLFLDLPENSGVVFVTTLKPPSFPLSFEFEEIASLPVYGSVATGRIYERPMRSRQTGEFLGTSTSVELVTTGPGLNGIKRIPLVVQFSLASNPNRNVMPWVLKKAATLSKVPFTVDESLLTKEVLTKIFPRGMVWNFVPALDLNLQELSELVEYSIYVQSYYGDSTYTDSSLLSRVINRSWFPVVLDIVPLAEVAE